MPEKSRKLKFGKAQGERVEVGGELEPCVECEAEALPQKQWGVSVSSTSSYFYLGIELEAARWA